MRCTSSTAVQSSSLPRANPLGRLMPATFTTASSEPNSSTSSANSARTAASSVTDVFDALRPAAGRDDLVGGRRLGGLVEARRAVQRQAGVDGHDERAGAAHLLGDRGADAGATTRHDHDSRLVRRHGSPRVRYRDRQDSTYGSSSSSPAKSSRARHSRSRSRQPKTSPYPPPYVPCSGLAAARVALEVQPRRRAGGHERAPVGVAVDDLLHPVGLGVLGRVGDLHAPLLEQRDRPGDELRAFAEDVREVHADRALLAGRRHHEQVREPAGQDAQVGARTVLPLLREAHPAPADDRVAGAAGNGVTSASKPVA